MASGRRLLLGVTGMLLTLFTVSCDNPFRPNMRKQTETPAAATADSPTQLLLNLEDAYNRRDIDLYKECLHPAFRFVLISSESNDVGVDMDADGVSDDWWDYDVEVRYHENLFGYGSGDGLIPPPVSIDLDLQIPPEDAWMLDNQDSELDQIVIPCYFDLRLTYTGNYQDITASGYSLFFVTQTDGVWTISRWQDQSSI